MTPEENKARQAIYRAKPGYKEKARERHLQNKYGVSSAWVAATLEVQGGCGICGSQEHKGLNWVIDHDHACCPGKKTCGSCIRGILCVPCNLGLGYFQDSPELLGAATDYLSKVG